MVVLSEIAARLFWPERLLPVSFLLSTHTVLTTHQLLKQINPCYCLVQAGCGRIKNGYSNNTFFKQTADIVC